MLTRADLEDARAERCRRCIASRAADGDIAAVRSREAARLDQLVDALWPSARAGNLDAHRQINAHIKARRELLGLDTQEQAAPSSSAAVVTLVISSEDPEPAAGR